MAGPAVALIGLFGVVPLLWTLVMSVQYDDLQTAPRWAGGANYRMLVHDPLFWESVRHTLTYTALFVPSTLLGSLLLAGALNRRIRGVTMYRLAAFMPVVTSTVATGVMFNWLLDPDVGIANALLRRLGLAPHGFFASPGEALYAVAAMAVWGWVGFGALIYLAALQSVPRELLEAARMDGASAVQAFWRIQVPLLGPVTAFLSILGSA